MTKIDEALVERMVKLVQSMAALGSASHGGLCGEAFDIAASLPKPVDPEKEAVRQILREGDWYLDIGDEDMVWSGVNNVKGLALAAFRAGREYQKEQG